MGNRLYVGNLSFNSDVESVRDAFASIGAVDDVHLVMDRETGRPRGFAFVTMSSPDLVQKAIDGLNGSMLDGRALRVNEAEERTNGGGGARNGGRRHQNGNGGGSRW